MDIREVKEREVVTTKCDRKRRMDDITVSGKTMRKEWRSSVWRH